MSQTNDAEARHPSFNISEIDAYLNGHDDGVRRDSWRFDRIKAERQP